MNRMSHPLVKISGEQTIDVSRNLLCSNRTSTIQQLFIRIAERLRNFPARVFPLVNQLLEHTRVRVLRNEALAQQLKPFARDLRDNRRIVQEPPAAKRHQVAELPRRYAQLVLVFTRKKRHQEFDVRILRTESL